MDPADRLDKRVLALAPTGRDARVLVAVLERAQIPAEPCRDIAELCAAFADGAGVLLVAEEALTRHGVELLRRTLRAQEPWSDVPLVVSTIEGETTHARRRTVGALEPAANVVLLERPVRLLTFLATIQSALRARARQYELRAVLASQAATIEALRVERELRSRFVAVLAHDLRGPLASARLTADQLALRPERLETRPELALRIRRNIDRCDSMIRDLLDANRLQAGQRLPLRLDDCDLARVAGDVAEELNAQGESERVQVLARGAVRGVWSEDELRRAVWNLVSNALKYGAPDTPVRITVRLADGGAELAVHNEGAPIPQEEQALLFEPFTRARGVDHTGPHGWGLGLTLVRGCAEAHGGRITIESADGRGTTFRLWLPLDSRAAQPAGR